MDKSNKQKQTADLIASLEHTYQLKSVTRSGWVQAGIPVTEVESIASHSFGMALLILYLRSELLAKGINVEHALEMAVIHDIAESIAGDITPQDKISAPEKYQLEADAFQQITNKVRQGEHFQELWEEFEAGISPEAQAVKRIDKLDMLIQAYLYEKKYAINLDSFWENMDPLFKDSESELIYDYIRLNRFQRKGN